MSRSIQSGRTVSSRLLEILFSFRLGRSQLTVADLTRITGMPHATVRRLVIELVEAGVLERGDGGLLTVGVRLWQVGMVAPQAYPLRSAAIGFMEDLQATLGEHVQLAVRVDGEVVVVERLSDVNAVVAVSQVGGRLPLHASAVGRILLAHSSRQLVDRVSRESLPAYTSRTVTDPARLRAQLVEHRATGVAVVREELSPLADSVATRVMDAKGQVVAALSVIARSGRTDLRSVTPSVVACGLGISRVLGWERHVGVRSAP